MSTTVQLEGTEMQFQAAEKVNRNIIIIFFITGGFTGSASTAFTEHQEQRHKHVQRLFLYQNVSAGFPDCSGLRALTGRHFEQPTGRKKIKNGSSSNVFFLTGDKCKVYKHNA